MKTFLLIVSIVMIALAVVSSAYAALNLFGYYHTLDGSHELYERLQKRATTFFVIGIVLAVLGAAGFVIRALLRTA